MLLRAIFWMAVVGLLMPLGTSAASCETGAHCSRALELLNDIRASGLHSLHQVRADIENAEQARAQRG
ncbi:MAG TPA: hypothetical protein VHW69_07025 [Rhizomicrobium sp.]|jgi:hypothetical protein|nr:hypothetical protein [Rhizomicrobium sp.]